MMRGSCHFALRTRTLYPELHIYRGATRLTRMYVYTLRAADNDWYIVERRGLLAFLRWQPIDDDTFARRTAE